MTVICITQARMGSSRMPGKVLERIDGISLIEYHFGRVACSRLVDQHWLSTSDKALDDELVNLATSKKWLTFRGDEINVLTRFYETAIAAKAKKDDTIIRLTGDCPLICPELLDEAIQKHLNENKAGYTHLRLDYLPRGLDVEVFSMQALKAAYQNAKTEAEREHVTLYIYSHPHVFDILPIKSGQAAWRHYRLCVDEPADFELVQSLLGIIKEKRIDWRQVSGQALCKYLDERPHMATINHSVVQKTHH